ncbi:hypothetical protein Tco_0901714 [Tanacetum coccineum]
MILCVTAQVITVLNGVIHCLLGYLLSFKELPAKVNKARGKENVVADALNRKERDQPLRFRVLVMTIGLDLPKQILNAQTEARKPENIKNKDVV